MAHPRDFSNHQDKPLLLRRFPRVNRALRVYSQFLVMRIRTSIHLQDHHW